MNVRFPKPNPKQELFLRENQHKYVGFGGARGGGKSWAIRTKSVCFALKYAGIKILIVRRTYPELVNNHILPLRRFFVEQGLMPGYIKYNDTNKRFTFFNGSTISFTYCQKDNDLDRLQGTDWDVIFLDEATQLSEYQCKAIAATLRGVNKFPKQVYYTCNPGGQSHGYFKRIFVDKRYDENEHAEDYVFIQSLVTDNTALMQAQPDYIKQLEALPPRLRDMWLYGKWDIFEGMFFEDFRVSPDISLCEEKGIDTEKARKEGRFTHVIEPLPVSVVRDMNIYRSYDFGYNKPFSCAWWAVDHDGVIYRILELYGCTNQPNEGVKWDPDKQFAKIAEIEREHPYLRGKTIQGVADPAIWDESRGESIYNMAVKHRVSFSPGDNKRIPGWMQCHYRLAFDENGYAMMYVFDTCRAFIRTIPTLMYSQTNPEDLDTTQEDHVADEWRYFCMSRPISPRTTKTLEIPQDDPLGLIYGDDERKHKRLEDM